MRKRALILVAVTAMVLIAFACLYGPLFPWSPIKPGYERLRLARADVYFGAGTHLDPAYRQLDHDISGAEQFHELKLHHRMTIIVCRSWSDFHRFLPTVRGEGLGAATPEYGTVIFITPKTRERQLDSGEFLRHELSHAVIHQNSTLWKSLQFKRAPWLFEGIAVLSANQQAYGTWEDFERRMRMESIAPLFSTDARRTSKFDMRFAYLAWRYFLAWIIETRGRAPLQEVLTGFMQHPTEVERIFQHVYGENLEAAVSRFATKVRAGQWQPAAANQHTP
jgi:hypothetical protein